MASNVTPELCEALCKLTEAEWSRLSSHMSWYFSQGGRADPEFDAARDKHRQLTVNLTPEQLYALMVDKESPVGTDGSYKGLTVNLAVSGTTS